MGLNVKAVKNFCSILFGKSNFNNSLNNNVSKILKKSSDKELFCHQYWKDAKTEGLIRQKGNESVGYHGYLNGINHYFINPGYPKAMDEIFPFTNKTPREMIWKTDFDFKSLLPTEQPLKVFRAIGKKPDFFSESKLYNKRLQTKPGDIIDMKEYAYATSDISYANRYLTNNQGILYEINIPTGSRVSRRGNIGTNDEIVFPRSSKFRCTKVDHVKNSEEDYYKISLDYIQPEYSLEILG